MKLSVVVWWPGDTIVWHQTYDQEVASPILSRGMTA